MLKLQLSCASLPATLCPQPYVCGSWEIYGGSINGFYRQLLERAEQGLAVGGPRRRLTAKTLKYYGPTYIKIVLCMSSSPSRLLTQEHGVWPESSSHFQLLACQRRNACNPLLQPLRPRPAASGRAGRADAAGRVIERQCQACAGLRPCPPGPPCPPRLTTLF